MNSMLATEPTEATAEKPARAVTLETWSTNERMRHIPAADWMLRRVDSEIRQTVAKILEVWGGVAPDDPRRARFEEHLKSLCRALDRLTGVAKHSRLNGQGEISQRIETALNHAVESLRSIDAELIGRRFPFHTFERSRAEPLYGALLVVMTTLERALNVARDVDAGLDERLLAGLVVLQNPVDERMLSPIA